MPLYGEPKLTSREKQVESLLVDGFTVKEIAAQFEISPRTVETHRQRIYRYRRVDNRVRLTRLVLKERESLCT